MAEKLAAVYTVTVNREEWVFPDVPGRYLIDEAGRWFEVSYCPMRHTTSRRIQIYHTDMHEKATAHMKGDAESRRRIAKRRK